MGGVRVELDVGGLYGRENVPEHRQVDFKRLRQVNLATGKAWLWKEDLRLLWTMPTLAEGKRYLDNLRRRAKRMKLRPVVKVAQMLKDHAPQVLNYFRYRVTPKPSICWNSGAR